MGSLRRESGGSLFAHEIRWPIETHLRRSGGRALRSFAPAISVMKAAEPGAGDYCGSQRRLAFHWPSIRRVLIEGIVNPVVVVVVHVIANEPPQVLFVQRDDMVENLAAAASDPAFRSPVLPRCLNTRALRSEARRLQEGNHIRIEFRVVVEDGITIRTSLGKRFTQLLHHPLGSRMTSDVEVQNPTSTMLDYEEAIQGSAWAR